MGAHHEYSRHGGFTLIELSIVLVIIGLIAGSVLVGQNLIAAASVRAQISQIEKYQTAVATFKGKYSALPGDMNAATAAQFGFTARGGLAGQGDGNSVVEGVFVNNVNFGDQEAEGETVMFWVDLTTANGQNVNLIDGSFSTASPTTGASTVTPATGIQNFFPTAKIGGGNYVYVWSGGIGGGNDINYFGLSRVSSIGGGFCDGCLISAAGLTVQQAYAIDKKVDDGLPQSGSIRAMYLNNGGGGLWVGASPGNSAGPASTTCYDNGGNASNPMQYSVEFNNGAGVNCVLSFAFQAGD